MINDQIIENINIVFKKLKKRTEHLDAALDDIAALYKRSIKENFAKRGRWSGDTGTINLFAGGSKKWTALAPSTKQQYRYLGYSPLQPTLRRTGQLMEFIEVNRKEHTGISFSANLPYAQIHQFGGKIVHDISITNAMRSFFWAMFYASGKEDLKWKYMALTKKKVLHQEIEIPARPYIVLQELDMETTLEIFTDYLTIPLS